MNKLFTLIAGTILAAATWFLLFVILGIGLGTSFIAGGVILAAGVIATGMIATPTLRRIFDAPLTSTGLLAGIAAFAVLEIVLSAPMWVGVVTGAGVAGLYEITCALLSAPGRQPEAEPTVARRPQAAPAATNGHDHQYQYQRETVAAR